jgi:hypothetical protein
LAETRAALTAKTSTSVAPCSEGGAANDPYIVINHLPKIRALEQIFPAIYREEPVFVSESLASRRSPGE